MHIFEYSRMEYELIVPEAGIIAAKAATTEKAVESARNGDGVGYKIFDVQKHHGVSLAAKAYASAWAMSRAAFDAVFYGGGPKITAFGYGVTNGGGGAVTCSCCCACPASQSSRSSSIH